MRSYGYHRLASVEFLRSVRRYAAEDRAVAKDFLDEVERVIGFVLERPEAAPLLHPEGVRRKLFVHRFPFALV